MTRARYDAVIGALHQRFEPRSRQTRYKAEFQTRRKKKSEGWADSAEDLKSLVEKGFPKLFDDAREQLALQSYLQQLKQPQIAFSVKQKRPANLDDAVAVTLGMESYLSPSTQPGTIAALQPGERADAKATVDRIKQLTHLVEQLTARVEELEKISKHQEEKDRVVHNQEADLISDAGRPKRSWQHQFDVTCWLCHQHGHMVQKCPRRHHPGELETPSAESQSAESTEGLGL